MSNSFAAIIKKKELNREKKKNKFGAKRTKVAGVWFDSKGESVCDEYLSWLEKSGEIKILERQCTIPLGPYGINYRADFKILDLIAKEEQYVEFKGMDTETWRLKKKLYAFHGPAKLFIYKAKKMDISGIYLDELIVPHWIILGDKAPPLLKTYKQTQRENIEKASEQDKQPPSLLLKQTTK